MESVGQDGKRLWATELGGEIASNILPWKSAVFLITSTSSSEVGKPRDNLLRSLSRETGITNWTLKLTGTDSHFLGTFNAAVIVVSTSGVIASVDAKSGSLNWKREIAAGFVAEPAFNGGKVGVATTGKQIFVISLASGEIESMQRAAFGVTALGVGPGGGLVAGDERGNVSPRSNGTDRANWKFKSGGEISRIIAVEEQLMITSHDNFIYLLSYGNGGVTWKRRVSGRVSGIVAYADSYALMSTFEENGAVLVDLDNGKLVGQVAFGEDETTVRSPIVSLGMIYLLTNKAAYAYSLTGCPTK
jgi:outer membrane protein assembly factor BamB